MSKFNVQIIRQGDGPIIENKQKVKIHYTGTLQSDGKKFDSTYDKDRPVTFMLGDNLAIKGLDQGILGMKVGTKAKITIPPELGYGK